LAGRTKLQISLGWSFRLNTLHFFWLQGEEDLKSYRPDLYQTQFNWIDNHPYFEIKYWDFEKLDNFVSQHYPQYKSVWEDIQKSNFNQRHIYCKMMDFTKFLVFHKYGGFYIDRDLFYLNPITELTKHKGVVSSEKVIKERFMSNEVGIKMYNDIKKYDVLIQDCFLGFEKGSLFCIDFIEWCLKNDRKMNNTMDSFSVFALTDYYLEDKSRFDEIKILDEDKTLFNKNSKGYCYHSFEMTWMDKSKDKPWKN